VEQLDLSEERGHLPVAGQRLEYLRLAGDPAKPLLVLLHEGLGCVALWRDFPRALAAATGCGVFVYSRAGYGGSGPCALPRPLTYMQDDAQESLPPLLAALEAERLVLLGHSDGGSIAAVNAGVCPDPRLAGLILVAPHFFTEPMGLASIAQTSRAYAESDLRQRLARYHGDNVDCAFRGWADSWLHPDFVKWDLRPFLSGIAVPTLMIQGADDEYGTPAQVETAAALIPGAVETHLLPGCGHSPQKDQREAVLRLIGDFVARL